MRKNNLSASGKIFIRRCAKNLRPGIILPRAKTTSPSWGFFIDPTQLAKGPRKAGIQQGTFVFLLGNKKVPMQNIQFDHQEQRLREFDLAFYSRLYAESPILAFAVAHVIAIKCDLKHRSFVDTEDTWGALRQLKTKHVCKRLGIPLQVIRKINTKELYSPSLTEDLSMLASVFSFYNRKQNGRWLLHAKVINLFTARAMHMITCTDAKLWDWFNSLPPSTAGHVTDILVQIHNILEHTDRRWQHGMVRDEVSLARTYERGTALKFPEPPFTDSPRSIGAIRTGGELASWGLKQRNCAASLTSRCVTGSVVVYKMLWPAEGTIVISTHGDEKPWLLEARARENGELDRHQLAVLLEWLGQQGISAKNWLERGAF